MRMLLTQADAVLRARWSAAEGAAQPRTLARLAAVLVLFGVIYGGVMGTYGLPEGRVLQILYSAVKVPLLLLITFGLSLPSFFVINSLMGLRGDFTYALRALIAAQAGLTVVLAALAPFTAMWYASVVDYNAAILVNTAMFGFASITAQQLLKRYYRPLIERDRRHLLMLRAWLVIYAFVGVQMGWVLRPFIGHPAGPTRFFREEAWGNAYVQIWQIILRTFGSA